MESLDKLEQLLGETGFAQESEGAQKLLNYFELLQKWNARINLTASTEWRSLRPLFLEGARAAKLYPLGAGAHLDIGSGAGFPAMILRILVPRIRLELVESRGKKGVFLETAIQALGLDNSRVHPERLESLLPKCAPDKIWDCISWKGLKLKSHELRGLLKHADSQTQFWMFHGREMAVEDPGVVREYFKLIRNEKSIGRKDWELSIYRRAFPVSIDPS